VLDAAGLLDALARDGLVRTFRTFGLWFFPRVVHAEGERLAREPFNVLERDERRLRLRRGVAPDAIRPEAPSGGSEREGVGAATSIRSLVAPGGILSPEPTVLRAGRILDHHGP